ncbi:hypothetical protein SNE40_018843 [Patella caerulea]|uniref:Uncharacterized protein n=1 Tax=Patella caerulea TaxID=87958 RepID=A0AAN8J650_PATCE
MPESPSTPTEVNTKITFVKSAKLQNTVDNSIVDSHRGLIHAEAGDHNEDIMIVGGDASGDDTTNDQDKANDCRNDGNEDHNNNDEESENQEIGDYIIVNGVIIPRLNLNFSDSEPGTPIKTPDWISLWSSSTSDYTGSSYTPFSTSSSDRHTDDYRSISSHSSDILPRRPHYHGELIVFIVILFYSFFELKVS